MARQVLRVVPRRQQMIIGGVDLAALGGELSHQAKRERHPRASDQNPQRIRLLAASPPATRPAPQPSQGQKVNDSLDHAVLQSVLTVSVRPWLSPAGRPNSSPRVPHLCSRSPQIPHRPSPAVTSCDRVPRLGTSAGPPALCGRGQDDRALGRAFRGNGAAPARVRYHEYATDSRECSVDKANLSLEVGKSSMAWRSHQTNTLRYH